jgi:hypothetical protein
MQLLKAEAAPIHQSQSHFIYSLLDAAAVLLVGRVLRSDLLVRALLGIWDYKAGQAMLQNGSMEERKKT